MVCLCGCSGVNDKMAVSVFECGVSGCGCRSGQEGVGMDVGGI